MKSSLSKAAALAMFVAGVAGAAVLATIRTNAPAYPNSTRRVFEKPTFHTNKGDVVEIVRWGTPLTQVRTKSGRIGWMESTKLDTINIPAILSISKPAAKAAKMTAADDSAVVKKWLEVQKAGKAPTASDTVKAPVAKDSAKAVVAPDTAKAPVATVASKPDTTQVKAAAPVAADSAKPNAK
jgi:hypothetical protein